MWTLTVAMVAVPGCRLGAVPTRDDFTVFEACIRIGIGDAPVATGALEGTGQFFHLYTSTKRKRMLIEPVQLVCQMPLFVEFAKGIEQ